MNVYLSMGRNDRKVRYCSLFVLIFLSSRLDESQIDWQSSRNPHSNEKLSSLHYIHERSFDLVQGLGIHEQGAGVFHYIGSVPGNPGILHMGFGV